MADRIICPASNSNLVPF